MLLLILIAPVMNYIIIPGEANLRMADVVVINKIDTADPDDILEVRENINSSKSKCNGY